MSPGLRASTTALAGAPMQSSAHATGFFSSAASGSTTGFRLISGTRLPFGRSKWASSTTFAPAFDSSSIVGSAARRRVSSATLPSSIGTLKSTRTSAVLPLSWALESERKAISRSRVWFVECSGGERFAALPQSGTRRDSGDRISPGVRLFLDVLHELEANPPGLFVDLADGGQQYAHLRIVLHQLEFAPVRKPAEEDDHVR